MTRAPYQLQVNVRSLLLGLPLRGQEVEIKNYGCGESGGYLRAVATEIKPGDYSVNVPQSSYSVEVNPGNVIASTTLLDLNHDQSVTVTVPYWDTFLLLLPIPLVFVLRKTRVTHEYNVRLQSVWQRLAYDLLIAIAATILATLILRLLTGSGM